MAMRQAGRTDILPPTPAGDNTDSTLKAQQKDNFLCHLLEKCVKVPPMEWPAHPLAKVEAGGCSMRQLLQFLIKDNSDMHEEEGETERRVNQFTSVDPVGTTKMCRKGQNLSETDRFCVLGPLELVERGTYNHFI